MHASRRHAAIDHICIHNHNHPSAPEPEVYCCYYYYYYYYYYCYYYYCCCCCHY